MKNLACIAILLFACTVVSCGQTTDYETKTKDFLAQKMQQQAGDIFVMDSLVKTDGYEKEEKGMKVYVMEYDVYITSTHFGKVATHLRDIGRVSRLLRTGQRMRLIVRLNSINRTLGLN